MLYQKKITNQPYRLLGQHKHANFGNIVLGS